MATLAELNKINNNNNYYYCHSDSQNYKNPFSSFYSYSLNGS